MGIFEDRRIVLGDWETARFREPLHGGRIGFYAAHHAEQGAFSNRLGQLLSRLAQADNGDVDHKFNE